MSDIKKKARNNLLVIILLTMMLSVTTWALFRSGIYIRDNRFVMGEVRIDLNHGQTIFDEINIEPGKTAVRDFTLTNLSPIDIYYRLYIDNVSGSLKEALIFEVLEDENVICQFKIQDFNKENPCVGNDTLASGEEKTLTMRVYMDEASENEYQNGSICFDVIAEGVQKKNNEGKEFEQRAFK